MKPAVMSLKLPCFQGFSGRIETAPTSDCNTRRGLTRSSGTSREGLPAMVPKTCSIPECERPSRTRTLCENHYRRALRSGDAPPLDAEPSSEERFWAKVVKTDTCWVWTASKREGYGNAWFDGRKISAHRVSWEIYNGPIPTGLQVDHMCHNRACVNPSHLRLATNSENQQNLRRPPSRNTSGVLGVHWSKHAKKWQVTIKHNGKSRYLGSFDSLAEAEHVSVDARSRQFTHFQHPGTSRVVSRLTLPWVAVQ